MRRNGFITNYFFRYLVLAFIGLANALPIPLTGSVLSVWLTEAGYTKDIIGLYALLGIPFSLKILWTPFIDFVRIPFFKSQPRKGWMFFSLLGMVNCFLGISSINPAKSPYLLAVLIFLLSLFSGCLYIVGLAYELESLDEGKYGIGSSYVITGYRLGLLLAGGGTLYISFLWGWSFAFILVSFLLVSGCCFILLQPEPYKSERLLAEKKEMYDQYNSIFKWFWNQTLVQPCYSFFKNSNWTLIISLIVLFKLGDQLAKSMEGPFYLSLGFTKSDLATAAKVWGMISTLFGAFCIGFYLKDKNPYTSLAKLGVLHALSLICFLFLSFSGKSLSMLYLTVAIEHFTAGMAMTAFIYFLWRVCDKKYAPIQYALLWSVFSFKADIFACLGGLLAGFLDWNAFFALVSFAGISSSLFAWNLIKSFTQEPILKPAPWKIWISQPKSSED